MSAPNSSPPKSQEPRHEDAASEPKMPFAGKRSKSPSTSNLPVKKKLDTITETGAVPKLTVPGSSTHEKSEISGEGGSPSTSPGASPRRPPRAPFVRQRSSDSYDAILESTSSEDEGSGERFDSSVLSAPSGGSSMDASSSSGLGSMEEQLEVENGAPPPGEGVQVIEKGMRPLERKLSRTISQTWNAIDEHEEKKANKADSSGLQNVLQRRLSQLTVRQSRLQVLADGSRDTKFVVDDDYDGPKLPAPPAIPTEEHAKKMIAAFRQNKALHYRYAHELIGRVTTLHRDQGLNVQRIVFPSDARLTIVGDLHGQLQDLLAILEFQGLPSSTNWYLFNGDFVDRGSHSIEVLFIVYLFKLMYPSFVWLNRGNHEHRLLNKRYKFERQVKSIYDEKLYERIALSFDVLPLCTIVNKDVFVVHGGLTEYADLTVADIEKIPFNREVPRDIYTKADRVMKELMWSDPWTAGEDREEPTIRTHGFANNSRGAGILWAPSITMKFLERNRLRLIIRSHQMVDEGFKYHHSHHVVTLFSASYYCGKNENRGAIAVFENGSTKSIKYIQYCADPLSAQRTAEDEADMAARTVKQTLQKLAETIYHKRYKLLMGFSKMDTDLDGVISVNDWVTVLDSVIKINLRWSDLWTELFAPKLAEPSPDLGFSPASSASTSPSSSPTLQKTDSEKTSPRRMSPERTSPRKSESPERTSPKGQDSAERTSPSKPEVDSASSSPRRSESPRRRKSSSGSSSPTRTKLSGDSSSSKDEEKKSPKKTPNEADGNDGDDEREESNAPSSSSPTSGVSTTVRYREFLARFTLAFDAKMLRLWNHQQEFVSANLCTKALAKYGTLQSAFDHLTHKQNGEFILCSEFCQMLLDAEIGLSRNAAADFTFTIDTDKTSRITYREFSKRFRKHFGIAIAKPEVSKYVRQLGDAIYAGRPTHMKKELLQGAWTTLPKTPESSVDMTGLGEVLKRLKIECSDESKLGIFNYINSSGSGQISETEFRKAFAFRALESNAVLRVFTLVQKYSHDLGIAFVSADSVGNGVVDEEEFVSAVESIFEVKHIVDVPEADIIALFRAIADDHDTLRYHDAMSQFRITFK